MSIFIVRIKFGSVFPPAAYRKNQEKENIDSSMIAANKKFEG
jgi:hypothetical protein